MGMSHHPILFLIELSKMKNTFILALVILTTISGCKKVDKLTQFDMEFNETVVIPSTAGVNLPFNLFTPDIQSNSESTFAVNDTRKDLVETIRLTRLDLTVTSPSNGDFSFLKSVEIFISAEGLAEEKIAWKNNIPSDANKHIELETSGTDLKEFIKKERFTLRLNTVTDELLASDHDINVHSIFSVDAKVLGQ